MAEGVKIEDRSVPNRALHHAIINRFFPFKHSLAIIQRPPTSKGRRRDMCFLLKTHLSTILRSHPFSRRENCASVSHLFSRIDCTKISIK